MERGDESAVRRAGRLVQLKFLRSASARRDALDSIRPLPSGYWQARIGGRMRGRTVEFLTREAAERAVNKHYNEALLSALRA
jgi:hypothetical protein